ncbi:hypothetical protein [uncultured Sphingomonas sp.]|uniref:hypothetical protein n=1 Tax=uncultured Sphingomonas sp. TaxID=158754 RepID=UPI0035CBDA2B
MRRAALALPLLLIAAPAPALAHTPARPGATDAVRALQSPLAQDAATALVDQLTGIVLDTRVGPVAALTDPRDGVRATDTLRDLKHRDDPQFERHLHESTRRVVGTAAAVAGGAMAETAELQRTADRLQAAVAPLIAALSPPRDGY